MGASGLKFSEACLWAVIEPMAWSLDLRGARPANMAIWVRSREFAALCSLFVASENKTI